MALKTIPSVILWIILIMSNTAAWAQMDSTLKTPAANTKVEIYDVVAVYKEHKDSRGITRTFTYEMKGDILNYDQSTGVLTFKDLDGKVYSLKGSDFKYFEYDKVFTTKIKPVVIHARKDSGVEWSAGITMGYFNIRHDFTPDDHFLNGFESSADIPVCLKLGVGKYLNKHALAGMKTEYAVVMGDSRYFNIGARYQYMYHPNKNSAFYFPAELKYGRYQFMSQYQINDTLFLDNSGWMFPASTDTKVTSHCAELNLGQGVSFALKNKKSISMELMLFNQFMLSQKIKGIDARTPDSVYGVNGVKFSLMMHW
jgi:hypothetical protein